MKQKTITISDGIQKRISQDKSFQLFIMGALVLHTDHDWSYCPPHIQEKNRESLKNGGRLQSVYYFIQNGQKEEIWIITQAEPLRHMTVVAYPHEY